MNSSKNSIWPNEVVAIFDEIVTAESLRQELKDKVCYHINRLLLSEYPRELIFNDIATLAKALVRVNLPELCEGEVAA